MSEWASYRELAEWRGESVATLRRKLPRLYAMGFPRPIEGKWYLPACQAWAAGESATAPSSAPHDDPLMKALDGHRPH